MWIFPAIGISVMLFVIYMLFGRRDWRGMGNSDSALDILNKRYAKGEIIKEEFERMKNDILS